ncbi:MAG: Maf family nucleotide pyrophosphatase [Vicingaceae bacterium]
MSTQLLKTPGNYRLVLASQSPRRKELLSKLGYEFSQRQKNVEETFPIDLSVEKVAEFLSKKKAAAYEGEMAQDELIITADTVVILGEKILGKAENFAEAKTMLAQLSGKKHQVITGVCLQKKGIVHSFSVATDVYMKQLSSAEIAFYIENFKPFDKAGAYGIQEWIGLIGVEKIEGSYYNVMGLPVKELNEAITNFID